MAGQSGNLVIVEFHLLDGRIVRPGVMTNADYNRNFVREPLIGLGHAIKDDEPLHYMTVDFNFSLYYDPAVDLKGMGILPKVTGEGIIDGNALAMRIIDLATNAVVDLITQPRITRDTKSAVHGRLRVVTIAGVGRKALDKFELA